ncbi:unnamed protein product [marine sediment metagenome]|uniref:Uncharacterized protein n=1 Tax=marine sediment metagenome TaxID=412755 RepID=X1CDK3_9ZZZZ
MTAMEQMLVIFLVSFTIALAAYLAGRNSHNLARMEVTAAVQVAKQEVGWEYQRYRIESLRMDWLALKHQSRQEYVQRWGRPLWAKDRGDPTDHRDVRLARGR